MKKITFLLLCLAVIFTLVGCSKAVDTNNETKPSEAEKTAVSQPVETILEPSEYVLYQNIFYNNQGADYENKQVTKKGIFTILYDEYNSTTRYYVWGYNDNTKCCDWQWEIVPSDINNLPNAGSTVNVTGMFQADENALDGYWIENAQIEVETQFSSSDVDVDTTTMGGTLERVQVANMQGHADKFEGKTVTVYGRIDSPSSVQHPYYNNCFSQAFTSADKVQAIGTKVIVSGKFSNGVISDASVSVSNQF